jgi:hypothetical protein
MTDIGYSQEEENHYGQDAGKHIEDRNEYQIADL